MLFVEFENEIGAFLKKKFDPWTKLRAQFGPLPEIQFFGLHVTRKLYQKCSQDTGTSKGRA